MELKTLMNESLTLVDSNLLTSTLSIQNPVTAWVLTMPEYGFYLSSILSALMAFKLLRMDNFSKLTFINQMFLLYYSVDSVLGAHEAYYLFRIYYEQ